MTDADEFLIEEDGNQLVAYPDDDRFVIDLDPAPCPSYRLTPTQAKELHEFLGDWLAKRENNRG